MIRRLSAVAVGICLSTFLVSQLAYGQTTQTTTSTYEQTTVTPTAKPVVKKKRAVPMKEEIETKVITTTTPGEPRKALSTEDLEKLERGNNLLCEEGYRSYVGDERKNVCFEKAKAPDIAYTCVYKKKGSPTFSDLKKGPCTLDFADYKSSIIITKELYPKGTRAPLDLGETAYCCYRAAVSPPVTTTHTEKEVRKVPAK
jgi:hypothetical protein